MKLSRLAAFLLSTVASIGPAIAGAQQPELRVSVVTYDDLLRPVPGTLVQIEPSMGATANLVTDLSGATAWTTQTPGDLAVVTLGETTSALGITLGQTHVLSMPTVALGTDVSVLDRSYVQPAARPVFVSSRAPITRDAHHDRWAIKSIENGDLSVQFQSNIAMLLTGIEIQALAAYQGVQFGGPADQYAVGLLVRAPSVNLGDHTFVLEIDCQGHGFSAAPIADCYSIPIGGAPTTANWSATVFDWTDDRAAMLLKGSLVRGDNLILFKPSGVQRDASLLAASPPSLVPPTTPEDGGGPSGNGEDCIPTCPGVASGEHCSPDSPPASSPGCDEATIEEPFCGSQSRMIFYVCSSVPNTPKLVERRWVAGGSVTVGYKVKVNGVESSVSSTGQWQEHAAVSTTYIAQVGDGCGQCMAECENYTSCRLVYEVTRDRKTWRWAPENINWPFPYLRTDPCADIHTEMDGCVSFGIGDAICNRLNCP